MKSYTIAGRGLGACVLIAACVALALLILPGHPTSTSTLHFDGFITLPRQSGGWPLSVMDYLTVQGRRLFVASIRPGAVFRIPLQAGPLPGSADIGVLSGPPFAHGVAIDPATDRGFTSRSSTHSVDVFDLATLHLMQTVLVGGEPDAILFDPYAKLIYVADGDGRGATLIDPALMQVVGSVALFGKPEYAAVDPTTHLIYQNLVDNDEVAVVDLVKRQVVGRWPLSGCHAPTGIAFDPSGPRFFIACSGNAELVVFDVRQHRVVAAAAIGPWPDSVAYDPERRLIYTTGVLGRLVILRPNASATAFSSEAIWLHVGAHTLAIDSVTHRLYVAYASLLVAPRLAVFSVAE